MFARINPAREAMAVFRAFSSIAKTAASLSASSMAETRVIPAFSRTSAFVEPFTHSTISLSSAISVDPFLALGPRLPTPVHPQPLLRIAPDVCFDLCGKSCGILERVRFRVAGANDRQFVAKVKYIALLRLLPQQKPGHDSSSRLRSHARHPAGRTCFYAEEWDKDSLGRRHIRVHQDSHRLSCTHRRWE